MKGAFIVKAIPVILIGLICFALGNSWTILPSISHLIVQESLGFLSSQQYASLAFFLVLGAVISTNGATEIGRFYGVKNALICGIAAIFIGTILLAVAPFSAAAWGKDYRFAFFICSQFSIGLGIGAILTSINAFLSLYMFKRIATLLTGVYACINLGSASAPFLISKTLPDWWLFSAVISGFFLVLLLATLRWLPNIHNPNPLSREPLKLIFKKLPPSFWLFVIGIFFYGICEDCLVSWTTILFHTAKNIETQTALRGLTIFWATVTLAQITICVLVSRISPRPIYRLLPCLLAVGLFGIVMANTVSVNLLFFAISALGVSAFFSLTVNFAENKFHKVAELVSGAVVLGYLLGTVVGSLGIGFFYQTLQWKLEMIFISIGVIAILLLPMNFFLTRRPISSNE